MLSSTYPFVHGILNKQDYFPASVDSLPAVLQRKGFRTSAVTTMLNISPHFGFQPGFDRFIEVYKDENVVARRTLRYERTKLPLCTSEDINALLFPVLEERGHKDIFIFIWSIDTHDPYFHRDASLAHFSPPSTEVLWAPQLAEMHDPREIERLKCLFVDMIFFNDYHLGALIRELKERELFDETLFILTSDHGESFGEHGANSHGGLPYEEQIRIPLIIRFPHGEFRGSVSGTVQHIDIAPTILDYVGGASSEFMAQGKSFLPLLRSGTKINDFVMVETQVIAGHPRSLAIRTEEFKYIEVRRAEPPRQKGFRYGRGHWPLRWFERVPRLLFALKEDPEERQNLIRSRPGVAKGLSSTLSKTLKESQTFRKSLVTARSEPSRIDPEVAKQLEALGYFE